MKSLKKVKFILSIVLLIAGSALKGYSQKLKSVQDESVTAPAKVEIDGKLNEWDDTFQAYNPATSLYYTLSNDDKDLYLTIKSEDQTNSNKIAAAGIDFTINTADKKKEKGAFEVTYPMQDKDLLTSIFPRRGGFGGGRGRAPGGDLKLDSASLASIHQKTIEEAKEIKLAGFKNIPDSVISIYNLYGLKAAIGYDTKGDLTYEVAIPLKSLGLSANNLKEIYYNIKINGIQFGDRSSRGGGEGGGFGGGGRGFDGGRGRTYGAGGQGGNNGFFEAMESLVSPTDFWGKYTLAKSKS